MKPDFPKNNYCKSKPCEDDSCVMSSPTHTNTTGNATPASPPIAPGIRDDALQNSNFGNIFSKYNKLTRFQISVLVLLSFTTICTWVTVCLFLTNSNWEHQTLGRIEAKLSEYESMHPSQPYPGPGSLSTADSNLDLESTTPVFATTEDPSNPGKIYCITPLFQDLESGHSSNPDRKTAGYGQKPHDLINSVGYNKTKSFYCRKVCVDPEYHQSKFVYAYKTNITVEFESFGSLKKDAKASVTYETLKCLYPSDTFEANIVPSDKWYAPGSEPACKKPSTGVYNNCT